MILLMAWRNIWRHPTRSLVVIGAVALGIWAAISLTGFVSGMMRSYVNNAVEQVTSHVQFHDPAFARAYAVESTLPDASGLETFLQAEERLRAFSMRSLSQGMIASSRNTRAALIKGVDPEREAVLTGLDQQLTEGAYLSEAGRNPILLSEELASRLGVHLGSRVVLTFQNLEGDITAAAFRICGLYRSGNSALDKMQVYVRRGDLNTLLSGSTEASNDLAHEAAVLLENGQDLESRTAAWREALPAYSVRNYRELSPDINLYENQLDSIALIYLAIILLALVFGIINTMLMAVLERLRELGMLMAIGMDKARVFGMIVTESVLLGLAGMPIGLLLGLGTITWLGQHGLDLSLYADSLAGYGMDPVIYFEVEPILYAQVGIGVTLTCIAAAIYPAWKAVRLQPVEALHKI